MDEVEGETVEEVRDLTKYDEDPKIVYVLSAFIEDVVVATFVSKTYQVGLDLAEVLVEDDEDIEGVTLLRIRTDTLNQTEVWH